MLEVKPDSFFRLLQIGVVAELTPVAKFCLLTLGIAVIFSLLMMVVPEAKSFYAMIFGIEQSREIAPLPLVLLFVLVFFAINCLLMGLMRSD